jgi:hypothetical protein
VKILAIAALLAAAPATAAPPACLTAEEVEHITLFVIPPVFDALTEQCRASLPPNAYLLNAGPSLSQRLATGRTAHWERARAAFARASGEEKMASFEADTASSFIRDTMKAKGGQAMKAKDCLTVDRALGLLAPLPPENIAGLLTLALETSARDDAKAGKGRKTRGAPMPAICTAAPA